MKRVIALLLAVAFSISIFATPASAVCPNPNDARFVRGGMPNGDDGGWQEADSVADDDDNVVVFGFYRFYVSKYFLVYLVPNVIENNNSLDNNDDSIDLAGAAESSEASPR